MPVFSFPSAAVLSLRFLTPVFQRWYRIPNELRKIAAPSLAVSIGTGPLTLWHFYQLCPYSLLVNLAVIPLMNIVLLFAALTCGLAGVWPAAARFCAGPVYYILRLILPVSREKESDAGLAVSGIRGAPGRWR